MSDDRLPRSWVTAELGAVCEVLQGQSPPGDTYNADAIGMSFFQGKAEFGDLFPRAVKWCTQPTKVAQAGAILISIRAPVGPTNLAPFECCVGRGLAAIHPLGHIHSRFVLYALRASVERLTSQQTGSTFGAVSGQQLRSHEIPIAPLAEQQRIVAEIEKQLTRLDAAVAALQRVRANLKRYRASVLKAAVEGRLVETSGAPWSPTQLRHLLSEPLRNGFSGRASNSPGSVRTLTLTAVTRRDFSERNTKLTEADPTRVRALWLEPNDIFVERSNTPELVGSAALYKGPCGWAIFPDLLIRIRVTREILPEFLDCALQSEAARTYFRANAQGIAGSMPKIDQAVVESFPVMLPNRDEQHRIVAEVERRLSVVESLEITVENGLKRAARLRQSILKRAFEGRLVPQDPDDEPASALLDRVRAERAKTQPVTRRRRARAAQLPLQAAD